MQRAKPLPVAVRAGKADLPPSLLEEIKPLKSPRPVRFLAELAAAWLVIIGSIALAVQVDHWAATALAVLVIATRQNVLALLVHDHAHNTCLKTSPGDLLVNLFAAYPMLVLTVEDYAKVHLTHHAKYFSEEDPDHIRKSGEEWNYPMRPAQFLKILAGDIVGLNVIKLIRGKRALAHDTTYTRDNHVPRWLRPVYYLIAAALLTLTGTWDLFLLYWVLPLFTVFQVIVRWGAVCEHQYNRLDASVQETAEPEFQLPHLPPLLSHGGFQQPAESA